MRKRVNYISTASQTSPKSCHCEFNNTIVTTPLRMACENYPLDSKMVKNPKLDSDIPLDLTKPKNNNQSPPFEGFEKKDLAQCFVKIIPITKIDDLEITPLESDKSKFLASSSMQVENVFSEELLLATKKQTCEVSFTADEDKGQVQLIDYADKASNNDDNSSTASGLSIFAPSLS